eukprot:1154630-Pelagomonas_calceolata.AAC.4
MGHTGKHQPISFHCPPLLLGRYFGQTMSARRALAGDASQTLVHLMQVHDALLGQSQVGVGHLALAVRLLDLLAYDPKRKVLCSVPCRHAAQHVSRTPSAIALRLLFPCEGFSMNTLPLLLAHVLHSCMLCLSCFPRLLPLCSPLLLPMVPPPFMLPAFAYLCACHSPCSSLVHACLAALASCGPSSNRAPCSCFLVRLPQAPKASHSSQTQPGLANADGGDLEALSGKVQQSLQGWPPGQDGSLQGCSIADDWWQVRVMAGKASSRRL